MSRYVCTLEHICMNVYAFFLRVILFHMYEKGLSVVLHFPKQKGKKNSTENVINQWLFTFILKCHETEQPALEFISIFQTKDVFE